MRTPILAMALFALAACGDSTPVVGNDLATVAIKDLSAAGDLAVATIGDMATEPDLVAATDDLAGNLDTTLPGVQCAKVTCPMGQVCCADPMAKTSACVLQNACPMSSAAFACDGPEDCSNSQVCCASIMVGGMGVNCTFQSAKAVCGATCVTNLTTCPTTEVVRLCHKGGDCTDPMNSNCCELKNGSGPSVTACISDTVKFFTNPKCF